MAWLIGIPWSESGVAGLLIGEKTVVNEFVAYFHMSQIMGGHVSDIAANALSPRSSVIVVYALCGFSNFLSIAIQIGGIGGIAPDRRHDLARLGIKALVGGSLACFLTAAIAAILI